MGRPEAPLHPSDRTPRGSIRAPGGVRRVPWKSSSPEDPHRTPPWPPRPRWHAHPKPPTPENGPAGKAGVKGGDVIVGLGGRKILNIYDYTDAMSALKVGEETEMVVKRGDEELTLKVTPGSRD